MYQDYAPLPQGGRKGIRRWGIIWGLVLASITITYQVLKTVLDLGEAQNLVLLLALFPLLGAGLFAGQTTGKVGPGALAGVLAGVVATATEVAASLLLIVVALIFGFIAGGGDVSSLGVSLVVLSLSSYLILPYLLLLALTLIVRVIAGLGLGALGGLIGKLFYEPDTVELEPQEVPAAVTYYTTDYSPPIRMYRPPPSQSDEEDDYGEE